MTAPLFAWHNERNTSFASGSTVDVGGSDGVGTNGAFTAGTILIATVFVGSTTATVTPPSGWSLIGSAVDSGDTTETFFYWYACTGSEVAPFNFGLSATAGFGWGLGAYTGANTTTPLDGTSQIASWSSGGATSVTTSSLTTTNATDLLILIVTSSNAADTAPADMTQRANVSMNSNPDTYMLCDRTLASSGSVSETFTTPTFRNGVYGLFALQPSAGGATPFANAATLIFM